MTKIIRYLSDLHLEFVKPHKIDKFIKNIPISANEICILAGDIGNPYHPNYDTFMKFISKNFIKTFVIAGNHEYYNKTKSIEQTNIYLKSYFQEFNNITFLDNSFEHYENYCFVGTTLWSKITNPEYEINDVYKIPHFDWTTYNMLNDLSVKFLEEALQINKNCVVITHHIPSSSLIDEKYKTPKLLPYNQWFYCDMDDLIKNHKDKIKCWIYGHTHTPAYNLIHKIPFMCNSIGYPIENRKPDFQKISILDYVNLI